MSKEGNEARGRASAIIVLGFSLVIVSMIALAISSVHFLSTARNTIVRVVDEHIAQAELMHEVMGLALERSLTLQRLLHTDDPFVQDELIMYMGEIVRRYLAVREKIVAIPLTAREEELLRLQEKQTNTTGLLQSRVVALVLDERVNEAIELFYAEAIPSQREAMILMREFISLQNRHNDNEALRVANNVDDDSRMITLTALFGLLISLAIAFYVYRRISLELARRIKIEDELEERVAQRTEELNYLASHDKLTSLPNRSVFEHQLEHAVQSSRRYQRCYALLFLDLDGFKEVNDTFGHAAGDHVLVETARRLKDGVRGTDVVARVGGDEFTILLSEVSSKKHISEICEGLLDYVNQPIHYQQQPCHVGVSIGMTCFKDDSRGIDELLTEADDAMYSAKAAGKNACRCGATMTCCEGDSGTLISA